jgi:hypothetical protein
VIRLGWVADYFSRAERSHLFLETDVVDEVVERRDNILPGVRIQSPCVYQQKRRT